MERKGPRPPRRWPAVRTLARSLLALVLASAVLSTPDRPAAAAAPTTYVVEGHGWGHGRGMGQWGALGYAVGIAGTPWSSAQILDHFYGGTTPGTIATDSLMTVRLLSRDGARTTVRADMGQLALRLPNGAESRVASQYVEIAVSGTNAFTVRDGTSCDGPWTNARTVQATELPVVATGSTDIRATFGRATDRAVTGDWDGDGDDTIGVLRDAMWYLRNHNSDGPHDVAFAYGRPGDVPVVGDWDGNGSVTVGVRRGNVWYLRNSNTSGAADQTVVYGSANDVPVVGDWDGNGTDTVGVRRSNVWYLRNSNTGGSHDITFGYGGAGDAPVTGDWDGNGTDTPGVARPGADSTQFLLRNANSTGTGQETLTVGSVGTALSGSWTGDVRSSVGVRGGQTFDLLVRDTGGGQLALCTSASAATAYRGELRAINFEGAQRTVNALYVEDYLRGVVPVEVSPSWADQGGGLGMAAVEAQAVAARSYSWAENRYPYAKTCDTTACQVYRGRSVEDRRTDQAIANTAGVVRRLGNGAVARTEFSSSTGGWTVGPPDSPYGSVQDLGDAHP